MTPLAIKRERTVLGLRASALLEMALFFLGSLIIDALWLSGDRFFFVSPHPFWIIVLLMSAQYGTGEGLVAAFFSSVMLLFGNLPLQAVNQDLYQYWLRVAANPLMWLTTAVILGELTLKHRREREDLKRALADSTTREHTIASAYETVRDTKQKLELRIAGQLRSGIMVYQAAKELESLRMDDAVAGLETLIETILNAESFSIFLRNGDHLDLLLAHGWKETDSFTRQLRLNAEPARTVAAERKLLCIANAEHEALLSGQGVMCAPVIDPVANEVLGLIKIERLGFADLNVSSLETLKALGEWGGLAFGNAERYAEARENSMLNPDHALYTESYFKRHTDYITALARRLGFEATLVLLRIKGAETMPHEARIEIGRALRQAADSVLRSVDLAFDYQSKSVEYSIVLPATDAAGAEIVVQKIKRELSRLLRDSNRTASVTFSVQPLSIRKAA